MSAASLTWRTVRDKTSSFHEDTFDRISGRWAILHLASSTRGAWCLYNGVEFIGDYHELADARREAQRLVDAAHLSRARSDAATIGIPLDDDEVSS